jgi:hypothetical protein
MLSSTPTEQPVGPYARSAQAAHLLGRVIRHKSNKIGDPSFQLEEALQLDRTLQSLTVLLPEEEADMTCERYCCALAICYRYRDDRIYLSRHS